MQYLNAFDLTTIVIYFLMLLVIGFVLQRRATSSLNDYFLAGKRLPWWMLGASGMASNLDMTGTMLIISFLFLFGPRGLFIEFRGGAVLILPVMLLWTGKWFRRSNCMTGAEWMMYRFGEGAGGHFARISTSLCVVIGSVGGLAYLTKGAGLFLGMFTAYSPMTCALAMVAVAAIYTMASGFYGVVYTDLLQSGIILAAVVAVVILATGTINAHPEELAAVARSVTGSPEWTSSVPHWEATVPKGEEYAPYRYLFMYAMFALMHNLALGMSMGADPKYFGARNERECGTLTFMWTALLMFRWPMMISIAVLGLFLVKERIPDQRVLKDAEALVKQALLEKDGAQPDVDWATFRRVEAAVPRNLWNTTLVPLVRQEAPTGEIAETLARELGPGWRAVVQRALADRAALLQRLPRHLWDERVAEIGKHPDRYPHLAGELTARLGDDWATKIKLLSYDGEVNPERILPAVLLYDIPIGLRGLMLVALLAAAMSTFDSNMNGAAAYFTRDIYQRYLRPDAPNRELMIATCLFIAASATAGLLMGYSTTSINDIWSWLVMGLNAGLLVPGLLKFYWWRFNATGVVVGTLFGLTGAIADWSFPEINEYMRRLFPAGFPPELVGFVYLTLVGMAGAILGTFLGRPNKPDVIEHFYRTTRPFGLWGPLKRRLSPAAYAATSREHRNDVIALPFTVGWQITLFLTPMLLVVRNFQAAAATGAVFSVCLLGMYVFWYRNLPPAGAGVLNALDSDGQPVIHPSRLPSRRK